MVLDARIPRRLLLGFGTRQFGREPLAQPPARFRRQETAKTWVRRVAHELQVMAGPRYPQQLVIASRTPGQRGSERFHNSTCETCRSSVPYTSKTGPLYRARKLVCIDRKPRSQELAEIRRKKRRNLRCQILRRAPCAAKHVDGPIELRKGAG